MRASTFTTYINAQTDPGLEAAFDRQTRAATSSYATITQAAQEATRATAGLLGGRSTGGISAGTRNLQQRATATKDVTRASADAERATARFTNTERRHEAQTISAARAHNTLTRSLNTTSTALAVVEGRMSPVAGRLITLARAAEQLSGIQLGLAGAGAALFALGQAGNNYATLASRIRPFFETQQDANKAMSDVVGIAQRSRASLESVVDIYARLTSQTDQLGISQARVGRATEIASKAATLSGGTAQAREGALVQFSQALGANFRGSGQEFQSLREGAPILLQAIADGFKNVDGSIGTTQGHLRELATAGKLTSAEVLDALDRSAASLDTKFNRLPKTLSSAGTAFGNSLTTLVGRFDQSIGFTNTLAVGLASVADNLRVVAGLAVGIGAAFLSIKAGNIAKAGAANISSIVAQRRKVAELDEAWIRDARITAGAYQARVYELEKERAAIRAEIADIISRGEAEQAASAEAIAAIERRTAAAVAGYEREAEAAAAVAVAAKASGGATVTGSSTVRGRSYPTITTTGTARGQLNSAVDRAADTQALGTAEAFRAQADATDKAAKAALAEEVTLAQLAVTNAELKGTTEAAAAAQARLEIATQNVATRVGLFRSAGSSLLALLGGPWGIAFAVATTAVYLLATAESAAEKATRLHEESQRSFANVIDVTTGKVYNNIDALQKLDAQRKSSIDRGAQISVAESARKELLNRLTNYANDGAANRAGIAVGGGEIAPDQFRKRLEQERSPEQRELAAAIRDFGAGTKGSFPRLADTIERLSSKIPALGADRRVLEQADLFRTSTRNIGQTNAGRRILRGEARPGDEALVRGERPPAAPPKFTSKSRVQLAADAATEAARTPLQRAKAELASIRAEPLPKDDAAQKDYIARLAAAKQNVESLGNAEGSLRSSRRSAISDAKQEGIQAAGAKRDQALADLYSKGLNPQTAEYKQQRDAILSTYDAEIAKLRGLKNEHTSTAAAAEADAKATAAYVTKMGEARAAILANYDDVPKPVDQARDRIRDLQKAVGTEFNGVTASTDANPLGRGIYTQEIADADAQRINDGVRKPLADIQRDQERNLEVAKLQLQGRDAEANALRTTFGLVDSIGQITAQDYQQLVQNEQQELRINDALASRQRIVGLIQGTVDSTRDTFEQFLTDLPNGVGKAAGNAFSAFKQRFAQINARALTEQLFAGADEKVRALLTGKADVNGALNQYIDTLGKTETAQDRAAAATENYTARVNAAAAQLPGAAGGIGGTDVGSTPGNVGAQIANTVAGGSGAAAAIAGIAATAAGKAVASNDNSSDFGGDGDIVVTASRALTKTTQVLKQAKTPGPIDIYNTLGKTVGGNLDKLFNKTFKRQDPSFGTDGEAVAGGKLPTQFFSKLGDKFGTALGGAAKGAAVNSILAPLGKALGFKTSQTGAQLGGAVGSFVPIPGGAQIGAVLGSIAGGLLKTAKKGGSTISLDATGNLSAGTAFGNSGAAKKAATGAAGAVVSSIESVASALGAKITGSPNIAIGQYNKSFRVQTDGSQHLGGKNKGAADAIDFGDDQQAAVEYAVRYAIEHSVIGGISQASINIIKSGQDLQKAIEKASIIESIPKKLLQLTDPVRYAVQTLNDEFTKTIAILKEGGASADQFSDAQKLYELERADAIKQATNQASQAIDQFLKDMTSSTNSPLNKKTVYENASDALASFKSDISAGKVVDQNDLLSAARNFQDASRALNGSSEGFFQDFDMLRALLEKARDNAGITNVSTLPASPFASDKSVQDAIAGLQSSSVQATQDQTTAIVAKLDQLIGVVGATSPGVSSAGGSKSSIDYLPGFAAV